MDGAGATATLLEKCLRLSRVTAFQIQRPSLHGDDGITFGQRCQYTYLSSQATKHQFSRFGHHMFKIDYSNDLIHLFEKDIGVVS